jgi:hypothetical protein
MNSSFDRGIEILKKLPARIQELIVDEVDLYKATLNEFTDYDINMGAKAHREAFQLRGADARQVWNDLPDEGKIKYFILPIIERDVEK